MQSASGVLAVTRDAAREGIEPRSRGRGAGDRLVLAILLCIPLAATLLGLPYYLLSPAGRVRSALHEWLKPSGAIGLGFGVAAFALFLFMWLYPIRKRWRWVVSMGSLAAWLRVHILAGVLVPFVAAVHAGWRFDGLIGLGYISMLLVALSGAVGRYLYGWIPRSRGGLQLTRDEVTAERHALLTRIAAATGLDPLAIERSLAARTRPGPASGPARTVARLLAEDLARRRALREIRREWSRPRAGVSPPDARGLAEAIALARRELALDQQVQMLDATQRVFALWHVVHLPFALTALLAVLVHVFVAVVIGGVWPL